LALFSTKTVLSVDIFKLTEIPERFKQFYKPTFVVGILYLFLSLWILSIWGHHAEKSDTRLIWSVIFGIAALGSIYHGLRFDNSISKGFGVTFFLINLYTKFFETFWNS